MRSLPHTPHSKFPRVEEGIFAADMKVTLENDGPVTFMIKY